MIKHWQLSSYFANRPEQIQYVIISSFNSLSKFHHFRESMEECVNDQSNDGNQEADARYVLAYSHAQLDSCNNGHTAFNN